MPKVKNFFSEMKALSRNVQKNITTCAAYHGCRTLREFEKKTGIPRSTVSRRKKEPQFWTVEQLIRIAAAFDVTPEWLMSDHSKEYK